MAAGAEGIFLDIFARLNMGSFTKVFAEVNSMAKAEGAKASESFATGFDTMKAQYAGLVAVANDAYRDMELGFRQLQIAEAEINELRARSFKRGTDEMIAAQERLDAAMVNSRKLSEEAMAAQRTAALATPIGRRGDEDERGERGERGAREPSERGGPRVLPVARLGRLGNALGFGALAATGLGGFEATRESARMQDALNKLHTQSQEQLSNLPGIEQAIMQIASQTGQEPQALVKASLLAERRGYKGGPGGGDLAKMLRVASQLSSLENVGLDEAIKALSITATNFNKTPDQLPDVASQLNRAVGRSGTTLQGFASALPNFETVAGISNLKNEDVWATLATLTKAGLEPERAGQNEASLIRSLSGQAGAPAKNMLNQLLAEGKAGETAGDIYNQLSQRGIGGTIDEIFNKAILPNLTEDQKHVVLPAMFENLQAQRDLDQGKAGLKTDAARRFVETNELFKGGMLTPFKIRSTGKGGFGAELLAEGATPEDIDVIAQLTGKTQQLHGLSNTLKNNDDNVQTIESVLGKTFSTVEAGRSALIVHGQRDKYQETLADINAAKAEIGPNGQPNVEGTSQAMDTAAAQGRRLKATFHDIAITLGDEMQGPLKNVLGGLADFGDWINNHKAVLDTFAVSIAAIGTAWLGLKGLKIGKSIFGDFADAAKGINNLFNPPSVGGKGANQVGGINEGIQAGAAEQLGSGVMTGAEKGAPILGEGVVTGATKAGAVLSAAEAEGGTLAGARITEGVATAGGTLATSITGAGAKAAEEMGGAITGAGATAAAEMRGAIPPGMVPPGSKPGGGKAGGGKFGGLGGLLAGAGRFLPEAFLADAAGDQLKQYQKDHPGQWNPALGAEPPGLQQYLKDQGYRVGGIVGYKRGTDKVADPFSQPLMGERDYGRDTLLGLVGGQPVGLRGGEGILTPDAVAAIGGKEGIDSLNNNPWSNPLKVGTTFFGSFAKGVAKYSPFGKYLTGASQTLDDLEKQFEGSTEMHMGGKRGGPSEKALEQYLVDTMSPEQLAAMGVKKGKRGGLMLPDGRYLPKPGSGQGYKGSGSGYSKHVAQYIFQAAVAKGYSPQDATAIVAYSVGESSLNPQSSGGIQGDDEVIGLFQEKAQFAREGGIDPSKRGNMEDNVTAYLNNLDKHRGEGDIYSRLLNTSAGGPMYTGGRGYMDQLYSQAQGILGGGSSADPWWGSGKPGKSRGGIIGYDAGGVVGGLKGFSGQSSDDDLIDYHGHWVKRPQSLGDWGALSDFYHNNKDGIQNNVGAFAWEKDDPSLPPDNTVGGSKLAVGIGDDPTIPGMKQALAGIGRRPWPGFSTGGIVGYAGGGVAGVQGSGVLPMSPQAPAPGGIGAAGPMAASPVPQPPTPQQAGLAPKDMPGNNNTGNNTLLPPTPGKPNQNQPATSLQDLMHAGPAVDTAKAGIKSQAPPQQGPRVGESTGHPQIYTSGGDKPGGYAGTPGRNAQENPSRQGGEDNTSKGFGLGGGLIGFAESLPGMALSAAGGAADASGGFGGGSAAAGAANAAMQIGFQELNRAIGYGGQLVGILGEGLMETFLPNDSPIADPTKNIFGKVALGIAGAHPSPQNMAGKSAMQLTPKEDIDAGMQAAKQLPMVNIENVHNHTNDHQMTTMAVAKGLTMGTAGMK